MSHGWEQLRISHKSKTHKQQTFYRTEIIKQTHKKLTWNNLIVTKAEKGRTVVIMEKDT